MGRGGARENAGRKTTWASGRKHEDTTVIRVPKEFATQLLEIAHRLDAGEVIDFVTKTQNSQIEPIRESATELVTNSTSYEQLELLPVVDEPGTEIVTNSTSPSKSFEPLSNKLLALRLNVAQNYLSDRKKVLSSAAFYKWLQDKDPDSIEWRAVGNLGGYSKGYLPSEDTSFEKLAKLMDWLARKTKPKKLISQGVRTEQNRAT